MIFTATCFKSLRTIQHLLITNRVMTTTIKNLRPRNKDNSDFEIKLG